MSEKSAEGRMVWMDMAKGIGILLVIYGHACSEFTIINQWICSFFMPLFFIGGGYCYRYKKKFLLVNVKKILIPYYFWGFLGFLVAILKQTLGSGVQPLDETATRFLKLLLGIAYDNYPLWFLVAYFVSKTTLDAIQYFRRYMHMEDVRGEGFEGICIFLLSGSALLYSQLKQPRFEIFRFDTGLVMLSFMWIGRMLAKQKSGFTTNIKTIVILCCGSCAVNLLFGLVLNGMVSVNSNDYGNILSFYLSAVSGSVFIFTLCMMLEHFKIAASILSWFGRNSLIIMCSHIYVLTVVFLILVKLLNMPRIPLIMTCLCAVIEYVFVYGYKIMKNAYRLKTAGHKM